nr:hypothetical protein [Tanacetum cinerariifolium]
ALELLAQVDVLEEEFVCLDKDNGSFKKGWYHEHVPVSSKINIGNLETPLVSHV